MSQPSQILRDESPRLAESPALLSGTEEESPASIHPGLRPSLTEVPVTPGIHLGEYNTTEASTSGYFSQNPGFVRERIASMAQTPREAAEGATSGHEVLRRLSLASAEGQRKRGNSIAFDSDPRAAYPKLELTGTIISATFCIPNSLKFRKGADWVRSSTTSGFGIFVLLALLTYITPTDTGRAPRYFSSLRFIQLPLLR